MQEPEDLTASHRIHIHLFSAPHEVLTDDDGHVVGLRTERTRLTGDGNVTGTGEYRDWPSRPSTAPSDTPPAPSRVSPSTPSGTSSPTRAAASSVRTASP